MIRLALIALTGLMVACGPPKRPPTYVSQVALTIKQPAPEGRLGPQARAALASAETVAFYPPENCPADGCGDFMSRLEREAMRSGLRVVSWQSLRGPERTIEYARQHGVDVLFEIDVFQFGVPATDLFSRADASFFDQATGRPVPVRNAAAVARRCIAGTVPALSPELALVLDLKMSSVPDGEVLWTYRTTESGLRHGRQFTVEAPYTASSSYRLKGQTRWKVGLGIASVVVSATAALATLLIDGTSGSKVDFPMPLYAAEALLLGTGVYWLATSNSKAHWGYSTPERTLCVPGRLAGGSPAAASTMSSNATCAGSCRQRRRLVQRAVRELFTRVRALRQRAPATAAPE